MTAVSKGDPELRTADSLPSIRLANKNEASEFFNVRKATIDTWIRHGCPVMQRGGQGVPWVLDLYEMARWKFSPKEDEPTPGVDAENLPPRERLEWYRGNMQRRRDALEAGEVVPADESKMAMAELLKTTMLSLDTLVDNVSRRVRLSPEQEKTIERIIDDSRVGLHAKLKSIADQQRDLVAMDDVRKATPSVIDE